MNLPEMPASLQAHFEQTPDVLGGKLRVRGTRISVEQVLELLDAGSGAVEIVRSFPSLTQSDISAVERLAAYCLMSPALEQQAIEDFSSMDWTTVRSAQTLLQNGGSAEATKPLLQAMIRFHDSHSDLSDQRIKGVETGFYMALLAGSGSVPTPEEIDGVLAACSTDDCRKQVESRRRSLNPPIPLSFGGMPGDLYYAGVGLFMVGSPQQLEKKIAQFPLGTRFYLSAGNPGTWFYDHHKQELQRLLSAAGMQLVDPPPRQPPVGKG